MALQIPCTGKEIIDEINSVSDEIDYSREHINTQIQTTMDDSFQIGDLINTSRTDMGDKYLLCNGAPLYNWEEYAELIPYVDNDASVWYHKHTRGGKLFVVGSVIYWIYTEDNKIRAVKYETLKDFLEWKYSDSAVIYTYTDNTSARITFFGENAGYGNMGQCEFNGKLYLQIDVDGMTKVIMGYSTNVLDTWTEVLSETGLSRYYFICNSTHLFILKSVYEYMSGNADPYRHYVSLRASIDGANFSDILKSSVYIGAYPPNKVSISIESIGIVNGILFINVKLVSTTSQVLTKNTIFQYNLLYSGSVPFESIGEFTDNANVFYLLGVPVYYNGTYYISMQNRLNGSKFIAPFGILAPGGKLEVGVCGQLVSRDENLYLFNSANNSHIYNVHFTDDGYPYVSGVGLKSRKDAKFASTNVLPVSESDSLYVYSNGEIVPKESGVISSLPIVSSNVGYTYIKAKE